MKAFTIRSRLSNKRKSLLNKRGQNNPSTLLKVSSTARNKPPITIAIVIAIVAVVVVAGLFMTGVLNTSTTNINPSGQTALTTLYESGLPTGSNWAVSYNGSLVSSSNDKISVSSFGKQSFAVYNVSINGVIYLSNASLSNLSSGSSAFITFKRANRSSNINTIFAESGLPSGTTWAVVYNSAYSTSSSTTIYFNGSAGTYQFSVPTVSRNGMTFLAGPSSGTLLAGLVQNIDFIKVNQTTVFMEAGLPSNATWVAVYNGLTRSSSLNKIAFNSRPGNYSFFVHNVSVGGAVYVPSPVYGIQATGVLRLINFSKMVVQSNITANAATIFVESGLPSGTTWSVTMAQPACTMGKIHCEIAPTFIKTLSSNTDQIIFNAPDGTYGFEVTNVTGYTMTPAYGAINASSSQTIQFTRISNSTVMNKTTFSEAGLPTGTNWTVSLVQPACIVGNPHCDLATTYTSHKSSTVTDMIFNLSTGAYGYKAGAIFLSGNCTYTPQPASGSLTTGSSQLINFSRSTACNSNSTGPTATGFAPFSVLSFMCGPSGKGLEIRLGNNAGTTVALTYEYITTSSGLVGTAAGNLTRGNLSAGASTIIDFNPATTYCATSGSHYSATISINYTEVTGLGTQKFVSIGTVSGTATSASANQTKNLTTSFTESGLPSGAQWGVTYNGIYHAATVSGSINFNTSSGTYSYSVNSVSYKNKSYTPSPSSGSLTAGNSQTITFSSNSVYYTTKFTESGLPSATSWTVTYGNTTALSSNTTITFNSSSGTYPYSINTVTSSNKTYSPSPASGSLTAGITQSISFSTPTSYTTEFTESGLPSATSWTATYDGIKHSSANTTINFSTFSGNFSYSISTVYRYGSSGNNCTTTYTPSPASGKSTAGSTRLINFLSSTSCTTKFTESGLPSGTRWNVTYHNIIKSATASYIYFNTGSGTYFFSVGRVLSGNATYSTSPTQGNLTAGTVQSISYSS